MKISLTHHRQALELEKNGHHFVLVYPNTPAGRTAAKGAVSDWLMDCELDFNRHDAELFRKAIAARRLRAALEHTSARDVRGGRRRP